MIHHVLIADDNEDLRNSIDEVLKKKGLKTTCVADGEAAIQASRKERFTIALIDLKMPRKTGLEVLKEIKANNPETQVILMTAFASVDTAIQALRLEAADYLLKPFSLAELDHHVEDLLKKYNLEKTRITPSIKKKVTLIGDSDPIKKVKAFIKKVAPSSAPVLILGESGTGKEVVAKEIHRQSNRANKPFIAINCAALSEGLLESELFGHEKGSFTGAFALRKGLLEAAHGGTLFLDEIAEIPTSLQVKLLRFLQEQEFQRVGGTETISVNVRFISATNRQLALEVKEKRFREDLFYRLNVFEIYLPPLRERPDDVSLLIDHFLSLASGDKEIDIATDAREALIHYSWPGNIRQLENILERAIVLAEDGIIALKDLPGKVLLSESPLEGSDIPAPISKVENRGNLMLLEKDMLVKALRDNAWNQSKAAEKLGMKRATLQYRMQKYGISKAKNTPPDHSGSGKNL